MSTTTNVAWLGEAVKAYKGLSAIKLLVIADFDLAAVSDGSMGCHWKDAAHVAPSIKARDALGAFLDAVIASIKKCDAIVAGLSRKNFTLPDQAETYFDYAITSLTKVKDSTDPADLDLLADCIALRNGDDWTRTVYGKAVLVRARRNVPGKVVKERTIQQRLLDAAIKRHSDTGAGYPGQLGRAVRLLQRSKDGMPVLHFAPMTLDVLHNSYANSKVSRLTVTRIELLAGSTNSLKKAYTFHFKHVGGEYHYLENPTVVDEDDVGMIFEAESKFRANQQGDRLCSSNDTTWIEYIKANFGLLLLVYLFNHSPLPDGVEFTKEDTKKAFAEISGRSAGSFTLSQADEKLRAFDFGNGSGNPDLVDLLEMATMDRPGFGLGSAKYIETREHGVAYIEPEQPVGLNFHHILTGTGQQAEDRTHKMNAAHQNAGKKRFGTRLLVSGPYAVPYTSRKHFEDWVDEALEGKPIDPAVILVSSGVGTEPYARN